MISDQQRAGKKSLANIKHTLKFNKAPKSYNSTRKIVFQPSFFRAYVSFQVSISCWTRVQPAILACWSVPGKTGVCLPLLPEGSPHSATS